MYGPHNSSYMLVLLWRGVVSSLLAALLHLPTLASAQETQKSPIISGNVSIIHEPLLISELPAPGTTMTLRVRLTNTRDTERKIRALIVRDGRLSDSIPSKSYLDEYDQPIYEIQTNSPLMELSYQFILNNPDGSFASTERYTLRRSCVPRFDDSGIETEGIQGEERMRALIKKAEGLAREVANYDTAQKVLEQLEEALAK
ncbi:MAG: hypothetical protein K1X79_11605 [Oligoflexia bacterium]|nr:hypothetical protein [Oligoflexia bacterium]